MKTFKQFQEGVAALKVGSKLLPKLMIGVGAVGTYLQSKKKKAKEKEDLLGAVRKKQAEIQQDVANKETLKQNEKLIKKDEERGKYLPRKRKPENQFNSYNPLGEEAPTNSTGPAVPGTGDDSSTVVVKKSSMLRRKNYAKGGRNSRKPWLDHLKNK